MQEDNNMLRLLEQEPERGLGQLMDRYLPLVYTIVAGRLKDSLAAEDIEECVSDVFYQFYEKIQTVDLAKGSIKTYLSVMARHRAIDRYRKLSAKQDKETGFTEEGWQFVMAGEQLEETVFARETRQQLIAEILALGEPDSEIFIRKYYFGQSTKEIARLIRVKENTVDKKVQRGLGKLRKAMGGAS